VIGDGELAGTHFAAASRISARLNAPVFQTAARAELATAASRA